MTSQHWNLLVKIGNENEEMREAMRGILDFLLERLPALPRSFEYYAELIGDPHYFDGSRDAD